MREGWVWGAGRLSVWADLWYAIVVGVEARSDRRKVEDGTLELRLRRRLSAYFCAIMRSLLRLRRNTFLSRSFLDANRGGAETSSRGSSTTVVVIGGETVEAKW